MKKKKKKNILCFFFSIATKEISPYLFGKYFLPFFLYKKNPIIGVSLL